MGRPEGRGTPAHVRDRSQKSSYSWLHPTTLGLEHTLERIESTLRSAGFEGEVQFKSNPQIQISDVTIDWVSGQVHRSTENLWEEIQTLVERVPLELTFAETLQTNTPTTGNWQLTTDTDNSQLL